RYFPSRDDLLTALIIDAYNAIGDAAQQAIAQETGLRERWRAGCHAVRTWALAHRHEYALIYGSPVTGYRAPQDTVTPAGRRPLLLLDMRRDAVTQDRLTPPAERRPLTSILAEQVKTLAEAVAPELPPGVLVHALMAWTQLFGMVSFELFGQ